MNRSGADGAGKIANGEATFQLHAALLRAFVAYGKQMRSQRIKAGLRRARVMKKWAGRRLNAGWAAKTLKNTEAQPGGR